VLKERPLRVGVLGSVQRAAPVPYASRISAARKRRLAAVVLVALSLVMITVYFRESSGGPLHDAQSVGATALRPFQVAAERVARPFRDVYGYFAGLATAKEENDGLRREIERLQQQAIQNELARQQLETLRQIVGYQRSATFPDDFRAVTAEVIGHAPSEFDQQVTIAAGADDGVHEHDPVVTTRGLVGEITLVTPNTAKVTLLTDRTSAVSASDLLTRATGLIRHGQAKGNALIFDRVRKEQVVEREDVIVTAGTYEGGLPSLYPKGIPIGVVTNVGQIDTDLFKQIQVRPFVDFSSLDAVIVLIDRRDPAAR
jgi:rod shape-determining protein MreC